MSEWSLIGFTLAVQLSCGLTLAATFFDRTSVRSETMLRPLGSAIFPLAAAGLLASLLHLGRPLIAWKALLNVGNSRLSLEIFVTLLFVGAAFFYSRAWWIQETEHRVALGIITSSLALGSVATSAVVYLVPTQPAWNSAWVPISFFGTALVLGGYVSAVAALRFGPRSFLGYSLIGIVAGSLLLIVAALWMVSLLSRGSPDEFVAVRLQEAYQLVATRYPVWFGLHLLLAGLVPILLAILLWSEKALVGASSWLHALIFLAISFGAAIGRKLMYLVGTAPSQF